jgi:S1-C subfamily serine protease
LISSGKYDYPFLGISALPNEGMSLSVMKALGLKSYKGAYVTNVVSGGPADKAGILAGTKPTDIPGLLGGGDLITAIDGQEVHAFDQLLSYLITNKSPGDSVVFTILRGNDTVDVTITLGKRP